MANAKRKARQAKRAENKQARKEMRQNRKEKRIERKTARADMKTARVQARQERQATRQANRQMRLDNTQAQLIQAAEQPLTELYETQNLDSGLAATYSTGSPYIGSDIGMALPVENKAFSLPSWLLPVGIGTGILVLLVSLLKGGKKGKKR